MKILIIFINEQFGFYVLDRNSVFNYLYQVGMQTTKEEEASRGEVRGEKQQERKKKGAQRQAREK